jgi:hypothetical protein
VFSELAAAAFVEKFGKWTGATAESENQYGEPSLIRSLRLSAVQDARTGHRQN